eukprot:291975-Pyramimonas_sp.AAC.1
MDSHCILSNILSRGWYSRSLEGARFSSDADAPDLWHALKTCTVKSAHPRPAREPSESLGPVLFATLQRVHGGARWA